MKIIVQRFQVATVKVNNTIIAFVTIEALDTLEIVDKAVKKLKNMRVFSDDNYKINLKLEDIEESGLLLISQFALTADLSKGNRPSFSNILNPHQAKEVYNSLVTIAKKTRKCNTRSICN